VAEEATEHDDGSARGLAMAAELAAARAAAKDPTTGEPTLWQAVEATLTRTLSLTLTL
jgi:hypothetical protein